MYARYSLALAMLAVSAIGIAVARADDPKFIPCPADLPAAYALTWSNDTTLFVAGLSPSIHKIRVVDPQTNQVKPELSGEFSELTRHRTLVERAGAILCLATNSDQSLLYSSGTDFQTRVWDLALAAKFADRMPTAPHCLAMAREDDNSPAYPLAVASNHREAVAPAPAIAPQLRIWTDQDESTEVPSVEADIASLAWMDRSKENAIAPALLIGYHDGTVEIRDSDEFAKLDLIGPFVNGQDTQVVRRKDTDRFATLATDLVVRSWHRGSVPRLEVSERQLWLTSPDGTKWVGASSTELMYESLDGTGIIKKLTARFLPASERRPIALASDDNAKVVAALVRNADKREVHVWWSGNSAQIEIEFDNFDPQLTVPVDADAEADAPEAVPEAIAVSSDGKLGALVYSDGRIYRGTLPAKDKTKMLLSFVGMHCDATVVRFVGSSRMLVTAGQEVVKCWTPNDELRYDRLSGIEELATPVVAADIRPKYKAPNQYLLVLATGTNDPMPATGQLASFVVDGATGTLTRGRQWKATDDGAIKSVRLSDDASRIIAATAKDRITVWSTGQDGAGPRPDSNTDLLQEFNDAKADYVWFWPAAQAVLWGSEDELTANGMWLESNHALAEKVPQGSSFHGLVADGTAAYFVDTASRAIVFLRTDKIAAGAGPINSTPRTISYADLGELNAVLPLRAVVQPPLAPAAPTEAASFEATRLPASHHLVTAHQGKAKPQLAYWYAASGELVKTCELPAPVVSLVRGAADDNGYESIVFAILTSGECVCVDMGGFTTKGKILGTFRVHFDDAGDNSGPPAALTLAPGETSVIAVSSSGVLRRQAIGSRQNYPPTEGADAARGHTYTLAPVDESLLAVGTADGRLSLLDLSDGKYHDARTLFPADPKQPEQFSYPPVYATTKFSLAGVNWLAAVGRDPRVAFLKIGESPNDGSFRCTKQTDAKYLTSVTAAASADGAHHWVAAGGARDSTPHGGVYVWKNSAPQPESPNLKGQDDFENDESIVVAVAFNAGATKLAALKRSGKLQLWKVTEGNLEPAQSLAAPATSSGPALSFHALAWNPQGSLLAVAAAPSAKFTDKDETETVLWVLDDRGPTAPGN
jgi:WD40 repeat protein